MAASTATPAPPPTAGLARADVALYHLARTRGHQPPVERAVASFSHLGEHGVLWLGIGALGAVVDRPRRGRWLRALCGVGGAYVANVAVKQVVRRRRPDFPDLPQLTATPTQLSFPSSHATSSFAGARAYAPLLGAAGAALYPLAGAMAASRVYLGVHYPSDILAGALLGTFVGDRAR
ncbi:MAG TPA: phosphatase PAP2 family protein [Baekduia sp.]|nr:phosphatase PAP2 family protein [Baekduia sp.]